MRSISIPLGKFTPEKFGSLEVERLTGLTQVQVRDWRRRGLLERGEGVRPYDVFDAAQIAIRLGLNRLGLPLGETAGPAAHFAPTVITEVCRRAVWTRDDEAEIARELDALLGHPEPLVLVRQDVGGSNHVVGLDEDILAIELSSRRLGPIWGVLDLSMIASVLYGKSRFPLVTFTDATAAAR